MEPGPGPTPVIINISTVSRGKADLAQRQEQLEKLRASQGAARREGDLLKTKINALYCDLGGTESSIRYYQALEEETRRKLETVGEEIRQVRSDLERRDRAMEKLTAGKIDPSKRGSNYCFPGNQSYDGQQGALSRNIASTEQAIEANNVEIRGLFECIDSL